MPAIDLERRRAAWLQRCANGGAKARASTKPKGVDPATTDPDYSADDLEFLRAIEAYKAETGRKFPTWCEVLGIVKDLGYRKP